MRFSRKQKEHSGSLGHGVIRIPIYVSALVVLVALVHIISDDVSSAPATPSGGSSQQLRSELAETEQPSIKSNDSSTANEKEQDWKWYDGNLNEYYNKLERDEHSKRDPNKITSYAVHRWMGPKYSTLIHYELLRQVIYELILHKYISLEEDAIASSSKLRVFDAGCGLGAVSSKVVERSIIARLKLISIRYFGFIYVIRVTIIKLLE